MKELLEKKLSEAEDLEIKILGDMGKNREKTLFEKLDTIIAKSAIEARIDLLKEILLEIK